MSDLSQLSDEQLRALYQPQPQAPQPQQQPAVMPPQGLSFASPDASDISSLSDDELRNLRAQQLAPTPKYSGMILPVSVDQQGNTSLDWNAGLPGGIKRLAQSAWSAAQAPGDVFSGKIPILAQSSDQPNPDLITKAADFAAFASPISPALRAGEMIPGELARNLGAPSAEQLKAAGSAGYDAARASGLNIKGDAVADMARELQQTLQQDHGVIAKTAPSTFSILDELASPPTDGFATISGIDAARRGLSRITAEGGTDGFAAGHAVRKIDDFLGSLDPASVLGGTATPEDVTKILRDARSNYAAAQRSNDITGTLDKANTGILEQAETRAHASHSGTNIDNAIRQRVASFLQSPEKLAGFSPDEVQALKDVVQGGVVQNTARRVGNILGGGGGLGQLAAGAAGAAAGGHLLGTEGSVLGAMLPTAIGMTAKGVENALARRSLRNADETIRMNSPLYREMETQGLLSAPAIGRNSAILRSVLPGLLSPLQPQSQTSPLAKALAGVI